MGGNIWLRDKLIFTLLSKSSLILHAIFILLLLIYVVLTSLFITITIALKK